MSILESAINELNEARIEMNNVGSSSRIYQGLFLSASYAFVRMGERGLFTDGKAFFSRSDIIKITAKLPRDARAFLTPTGRRAAWMRDFEGVNDAAKACAENAALHRWIREEPR